MKKIINKKGVICFLMLALAPLSAMSEVSIGLPVKDNNITIEHHHKRDDWRHRNPYEHRDHHRRHDHHRDWHRYHPRGDQICKQVTRQECVRKCHWSEYHRAERCRTYCRPIVEKRCWRR